MEQIQTTQGPLRLPDDLKGGWALIYYYSGDFSGVSATELMMLGGLAGKFTRADCRILCISADSLTVHLAFSEALARHSPPLPFPLGADPEGALRRSLSLPRGQKHLWLLAPDGAPRAYYSYPDTLGMNFTEVYRALLALQTGKATPADWVPGAPFLSPPPADTKECFGRMRRVEQAGGAAIDWYLTYEPQ